jgi:tight adherence protein B
VEIFIYILVFGAILFGAESLFFILTERSKTSRAAARKRLRKLTPGLSAPDSGGEESILRAVWGRGSLTDQIFRLLPAAPSLELVLYRAGIATRPAVFAYKSVALGAVAWVVAYILFPGKIWIHLLLGIGLLPWFSAARQARKRVHQFELQLPEALELMTRALRAGHSLTAAFQMVGEELPDPVGTELARVAEEIKLGQDIRSSLEGLAYRINASDLPYLVTAILIQRETGGNLTEILDKLGYVIRERFKLYGKVRALTTIGRASSNLLAVWPAVMIGALSFVNPEFTAPLWESEAGHTLIIIAAVMIVIGYAVCRRMAVIKV